MSPQEERTWGMLAHLSALAGAVLGGLTFIGPLVVYLLYKDRSPFVRRQAAEALNFQIITIIATVVSFVLVFLVVGILMLIVVGIAWLVLTIMAAVAANRGEDYRYPFNWRLVS